MWEAGDLGYPFDNSLLSPVKPELPELLAYFVLRKVRASAKTASVVAHCYLNI